MLDQLLLLLLLVFALLLRYILPLLGDWQLSREQAPSSRLARQVAALPVASAVTPRGQRRLQMLHRHEARHGIILMTILGPCRALEASQPPQ